MLRLAVPIINVSNSRAAEDFYCRQLGFELRFAYRPQPGANDPCYMGLVRDKACLHVSSFPGDGKTGSAVAMMTEDVDALFAEFQSRDVPVRMEPIDQTWGTREMYLDDPDGNCIRFMEERPQ